MKVTKKRLMTLLITALSVMTIKAQTINEAKMPLKKNDLIIGNIQISKYKHETTYSADKGWRICTGTWDGTEKDMFKILLDSAINYYGDKYPKLVIREFKCPLQYKEKKYSYHGDKFIKKGDYYEASATVAIDYKDLIYIRLDNALTKVFSDLPEGSRIALDQIRVPTGTDKEEYKDQVVELLLDKGFKVVAKEYLERLYEEQQSQQSGIYNDKTTVKENNLSAVGYYLNVKLTETSLRVQVINVSTGEYEGNVTIKLQE